MKKIICKLFILALVPLLIFSTLIINSRGTAYSVSKDFEAVAKALKNTYSAPKDNLRIMSYNLLADTPGYYGSPAYSRSREVLELLDTLKPDVTGLQETSRNWFYCLSQQEDSAFISPVKTSLTGTMTTIIYNKKTLHLSHWGEYVFERALNTRLRCAIWGVFIQKSTGKSFIVINTHLSLFNEKNDPPLKQTMELLDLIDRLKERYDCPLFLIGDFNSGKGYSEDDKASSVYEILCTTLTDTLRDTKEKSFGANLSVNSLTVDHIFLKGEAEIGRYVILSQNTFASLSDHYPIFIDVSLKFC